MRTWALTLSKTHPRRADWVRQNGKMVLLCDGEEIDPSSLYEYQMYNMIGVNMTTGKIAEQRGYVFLSPNAKITINGSETQRYAILQGSHLLYRGNLYQFPSYMDVDDLETKVSSNGNLVWYSPRVLFWRASRQRGVGIGLRTTHYLL